eukprot:s2044_g8.t3
MQGADSGYHPLKPLTGKKQLEDGACFADQKLRSHLGLFGAPKPPLSRNPNLKLQQSTSPHAPAWSEQGISRWQDFGDVGPTGGGSGTISTGALYSSDGAACGGL